MTFDPDRFVEEQKLRGVIASLSLSHHEGCGCDVCKAGRGDDAAFVRVQEAVGREEAR